jgi:hypothetical protein
VRRFIRLLLYTTLLLEDSTPSEGLAVLEARIWMTSRVRTPWGRPLSAMDEILLEASGGLVREGRQAGTHRARESPIGNIFISPGGG